MSFSVYLWYVLAPVLVAAHTVNNLDLGDEQGLENEGYQSDEKIFFSEYFVSAAQTQKELSPAMPFVRYDHHHLRAYFDPPPGLKALIKWVICLKMYLVHHPGDMQRENSAGLVGIFSYSWPF